MQENEDGVITFKEYEDFINDQKEKERIRAEIRLLMEEMRAKREYLNKLSKASKDGYKFSEPAVRKHKYWHGKIASNVQDGME